MSRDEDFGAYVEARWSRLVRSAVLLGCAPAEAEDVVQTALTRCLVHWRKVQRADDRDAPPIGVGRPGAGLDDGGCREPSPAVPPDGMRFVGIGHAAIAVPQDWGSNETRCGTPQQDTVVIDASVIPACSFRRPNSVESVELTAGSRRFDFATDREITIDGVSADRQATTCADWGDSGEVCNGTVFIPSLNVSFRAESSTSAAEVDRILEQIRVLPGLVAVPGIESANFNLRGKGTTRYETTLDLAGLIAEVRTQVRPRYSAGYILEVTPQVGTMVAPGSTVIVTVAR